jgi:hypothetical protein
MSKLQNIKAVKQFLAGEHRMQTRTIVGYEKAKDSNLRKVGEIWEEVLPNSVVVEWEQKDGYRIKRRKHLKSLSNLREELESYDKCYDDCSKKKNKSYTRYDKQTCASNGMCLDCLARYETYMKIDGTYDNYERKKKYESLVSFFRDAEKEKEMIKSSLDNLTYVEEDGSKETWNFESKQYYLDKIDSDFEKLKNDMLQPYEDFINDSK